MGPPLRVPGALCGQIEPFDGDHQTPGLGGAGIAPGDSVKFAPAGQGPGLLDISKNLAMLFGTPVAVNQWPDSEALNAELEKLALARKAEAGEGGVQLSNVGGWHSKPDFFRGMRIVCGRSGTGSCAWSWKWHASPWRNKSMTANSTSGSRHGPTSTATAHTTWYATTPTTFGRAPITWQPAIPTPMIASMAGWSCSIRAPASDFSVSAIFHRRVLLGRADTGDYGGVPLLAEPPGPPLPRHGRSHLHRLQCPDQ
jgi:hypothetical protein